MDTERRSLGFPPPQLRSLARMVLLVPSVTRFNFPHTPIPETIPRNSSEPVVDDPAGDQSPVQAR
ncbi:MAG: hypothetical protein LBT05_00790 [Planctomycetaceae bacterium]|nr:hypothetical protein [Planctomycetaceae bacterium]